MPAFNAAALLASLSPEPEEFASDEESDSEEFASEEESEEDDESAEDGWKSSRGGAIGAAFSPPQAIAELPPPAAPATAPSVGVPHPALLTAGTLAALAKATAARAAACEAASPLGAAAANGPHSAASAAADAELDELASSLVNHSLHEAVAASVLSAPAAAARTLQSPAANGTDGDLARQLLEPQKPSLSQPPISNPPQHPPPEASARQVPVPNALEPLLPHQQHEMNPNVQTPSQPSQTPPPKLLPPSQQRGVEGRQHLGPGWVVSNTSEPDMDVDGANVLIDAVANTRKKAISKLQAVARDNATALTTMERFEVWMRAVRLPSALETQRYELRPIVRKAFWTAFSAHCYYCCAGPGECTGNRIMRRTQWNLFTRALLPASLYDELNEPLIDDDDASDRPPSRRRRRRSVVDAVLSDAHIEEQNTFLPPVEEPSHRRCSGRETPMWRKSRLGESFGVGARPTPKLPSAFTFFSVLASLVHLAAECASSSFGQGDDAGETSEQLCPVGAPALEWARWLLGERLEAADHHPSATLRTRLHADTSVQVTASWRSMSRCSRNQYVTSCLMVPLCELTLLCRRTCSRAIAAASCYWFVECRS
eukprot:6151813-Prymnesium_polylepis.4